MIGTLLILLSVSTKYRDALLQLQTEDEKHSSFLDNRIVEGVELSHYFQKNISDTVEPVVEELEDGVVKHVSVFNALYTSCLQRTRKRRSDMLAGILRRYDALHASIDPTVVGKGLEGLKNVIGHVGNGSSSERTEMVDRMGVIGFFMSTIAYLPFESIDEPLVAIHWINRIASG